MYCLWCQEEIVQEVTWTTIFKIQGDQKGFCEQCKSKLPFIQSPTCPKCCRPSPQEQICPDCLRWEKHPLANTLHQNISIFTYSPFMKEVMSKWKYRGDYEIIYAFKKEIKQKFHQAFQHKELTIVPIPLSKARYKERGFNQAEAIANFMEKPIVHALERIHNEKQAKKSRRERLQSENPFRVVKEVFGHVVIIDDLYTTGATLHWAASLLKQHGAAQVDSFTLIRS